MQIDADINVLNPTVGKKGHTLNLNFFDCFQSL